MGIKIANIRKYSNIFRFSSFCAFLHEIVFRTVSESCGITKMKVKILAATSLVLLLFATAARSAQDVVPIFISGQKDRLNNPDPESGGTRKLLSYIEKETGVRFERNFVPWKRALQSAIDGKGIVFGASKTPERERSLAFSEPIYSDNVWIITRCDARFNYHGVTDLKGKKVGLIRDSDYGPDILRGANFIFSAEYDTNDSVSRFQKLKVGRTDALLVYSQLKDHAALESVIQRQYGALFEDDRKQGKDGAFCVVSNMVHSSTVHFAANKGYRPEYFKLLNNAMIKAEKSGKLAKWFNHPMEF